MNCPQCRKEVKASAVFCPYCQYPLKVHSAATPPLASPQDPSKIKPVGSAIGRYRIAQVWRSEDPIYRVQAPSPGKAPGARYLAIEMPGLIQKDYVLKLTKLNHPALVPVFGEALDERGTPFLIVGDVQGQTLDRFQAGMDANRAIRVFEKLVQILIYLHAEGITTVPFAQPRAGFLQRLVNYLMPAETHRTGGDDPFLHFQKAFVVDPHDRVMMFDYTAWAPFPAQERVRAQCVERDRQLILAVLYSLNTPGGRLTKNLETLKKSSGQMHQIMLDALQNVYPTLQALGEAMAQLVPSPDPAKTVPLPALSSAATARLAPPATTTRLAVKLSYAALTDVGQQRDHNEDNFLAQSFGPSSGIFLVADGMGGHAAGDVASQLATSEVYTRAMGPSGLLSATMPPHEVRGQLETWIKNANARIRSAGQVQHNNMGTTLTAALVVGGAAYIANVGDSRTYLFRGGNLYPLTRDHSLVASLVQAGLLAPEQAYDHPQRNEIYRSLGQQDDVNVDIFEPVALWPEDRLVLCSDGLWEMVRPPQLEQLLNQNPEPQKACEELIRAANQNGGEDNITVVIVRISF